MDMVVKYIKENKLELISVFAIFVMGICLRLAVYNNLQFGMTNYFLGFLQAESRFLKP